MTGSEDIQRELFANITRRYEKHFGDKYSSQYRDLFINVPLLKGIDLAGKKVLDVMCGSGALTRALLDRGAIVTGLDISKEQIGLFRGKWPMCEGICASIFDSGIADDSFDCAVIIGGLHHLHPRASEAVGRIYRLLKPGGHFCFCEPHKGSIPDHFRRIWYSLDKLIGKNEAAIDLRGLKREFGDRFSFLSETYAGGIAFLFVYNSMVFRLPTPLKNMIAAPLINTEKAMAGLSTRMLSCIAISQWRKR